MLYIYLSSIQPLWIQLNQLNSFLLLPLHALTQNWALPKHLLVSDSHRVEFLRIRFRGECPTVRGFSVEF